jgi:antiviral helicase SKI2
MILNLLRVEALKIEEMIKRSFSENATQALLPEHEKQVKLSEADLEKIKREPCDICDIDLERCHQACMEFVRLTQELHLAAVAIPVSKMKFQQKRLIVYKQDGVRTVGMLVENGYQRGKEPTLPVLEISSRKKRNPSDALPYLGEFAKLFTRLPRSFADMSFKMSNVRLSDIECLTETVIKYDRSMNMLNNKSEAKKVAEEQLIPIFKSWQSRYWTEIDWFKIFKNVSVRNILDAREKAAEEAQDRACISCPKFLQHFAMQHDEWLIKENIAQLRQLMSDQNLQLLPDYEQRVEVLKELGFVDENSRVELKGKVACEIHTADELVLTELILENVLADYEPEEIVALLSSFVFQEKTDVEPTLTANLERGKEKIVEISERVNHVQTVHQVILSSEDSNDFVSAPRFGMVEVVYEWARGMSFNRITDLTDVMEGTIVRVITRLDETCREVKNAARIIGDPTLFQKMQTCQEMIKRDVCATASLYM